MDVVSSENWERSRAVVKKHLDLNCQVWVHKSLAAAVFEVLESLRSLYGHKKSLAGMKGFTSAYEYIWAQYLREMYNCATIVWNELNSPVKVQQFFDALKADTIFFIWAEDHPVTGQKISADVANEIEKLANQRKIFSIRISHAAHFESRPVNSINAEQEFSAFSVRIQSFAKDLAVVLAGTRFKALNLVSANSEWDHQQTLTKVIQALENFTSDKRIVEEFESDFLQEKVFDKIENNRLYDRVVLSFADINGDRLRELLLQKLGISQDKSFNELVQTTSLCNLHDNLRMFSNWWLPMPTNEFLRGLILLDLKIAKNPATKKHVQDAVAEIRAEQSTNATHARN